MCDHAWILNSPTCRWFRKEKEKKSISCSAHLHPCRRVCGQVVQKPDCRAGRTRWLQSSRPRSDGNDLKKQHNEATLYQMLSQKQQKLNLKENNNNNKVNKHHFWLI